MTRLYVDHPLNSGETLLLPEEAAHHVRSVLRLARDDDVVVFNGDGREFAARLTRVHRHGVEVALGEAETRDVESPLRVTLVQAVSRGERMDYTLQKAVELGVSDIVPVMSQRTVVRLDRARADKRLTHWRGVVRHAAEQSGRTRMPGVAAPRPLADWLQDWRAAGDSAEPCAGFVLAPAAPALAAAACPGSSVTLIAGPEGGFEADEINAFVDASIRPAGLGPRVLRTETAAVCALSIMQTLWGDLR